MTNISPINLAQPGAAAGIGATDAEIVEMLAHVGLRLFTKYFNHVANTEIDFPFVTAVATNSAA